MKASREIHRSSEGSFLPFLLAGFMLSFSVFPANVFAGLLLDAELRFTYEDNVVGVLSDQPRGGGGTPGSMAMQAIGMGSMGGGPNNKNRYLGSASGATQTGDFSATVSADAGGYRDVGSDISLFAKAFAEHTNYNYFTDLNATIGGVSTGVVTSLSDAVFARVVAFGKIKRFGDSERDSTDYGGNLSLKEKLTSSFWIREFVEYENNNADNAVFSYTGMTIGAGAGYALTTKTLVMFGYNYMIRKFDEPPGAEIKTDTVYGGVEHSFAKSWSVAAEYDLQLSKENVTGSSTTDNIFSGALRYYY